MDLIRQLPAMSWRGIRLPVEERTHSFSHEQVPHHVIYRDGVATEMMGVKGRAFLYSLPLRESIQVAGVKHLFSVVLRQLYLAYRDPSPGILIDPVHGEILCTPGSWEETLTPMKTDGVDVRLAFLEHTPIGESRDDLPPTVEGVFDAARALDAEAMRAPWTYEVPSPAPTSDPLSTATGMLDQVNFARERVDASVMSVSSKAARMERSAEKLGLAGEPVRRAARRLRLGTERLAKAPPRDKAGLLTEAVVQSPTTISRLAADSGMTVAELIRSNPGMARSPMVPAGTRVFRK